VIFSCLSYLVTIRNAADVTVGVKAYTGKLAVADENKHGRVKRRSRPKQWRGQWRRVWHGCTSATCPSSSTPIRPIEVYSFYRAYLSVRLSVTLVDQDHIGNKSRKLIARTISPTQSLFVAQWPCICSHGEHYGNSAWRDEVG